MSDEEKAYYQERAEAELALAQRSDDPRVVRSHYLLAGYYLDRVHSAGQEADKPPSLH